MDLSKIPGRASASGQPEQPAPASHRLAESPQAAAAGRPGEDIGRPAAPVRGAAGFEVGVNLIIALLLLGLGVNFGHFLLAKATERPYHTGVNWTSGPNAGSEVAYFDLQGDTAWTDAGLFSLGVAALIEVAAALSTAVLPIVAARAAIAGGACCVVLATFLNAYICWRFFHNGIIPLISLCALLFAAWVLRDQWLLWKGLQRGPRMAAQT